MQLTPREKDKLLMAMAAEVARKRLARGVQLNYPEAIALISDAVVEGARDGRSVADMMEAGAHIYQVDGHKQAYGQNLMRHYFQKSDSGYRPARDGHQYLRP